MSGPEIIRESRRLAKCYAALAEKLEINFADAGAWGVELAYDGVHFSEAGHRAFAAGIRSYFFLKEKVTKKNFSAL